MKILIRKVDQNVYFDSKNYWCQISDRFYGYSKLDGTIYNHIWKPEADFQILPATEQQTLKSSTVKQVVVPKDDINKIAPRDRGKPGKYRDPNMIALKALMEGD